MALTQGDGHLLEVELVGQLLGHALVALVVQGAAVDVGGLGLDAEHVLGVLLVGDADVHVLAQVGHGLILTPWALAALQAWRQISTTFSPRAGVMPVKWNQSTPSKILSQSKSEGWASWMALLARS